jgi:hypothetical protein
MDGHVTHTGDKGMHTIFQTENKKVKDHLETQTLDGKIILKEILERHILN